MTKAQSNLAVKLIIFFGWPFVACTIGGIFWFWPDNVQGFVFGLFYGFLVNIVQIMIGLIHTWDSIGRM